MIDLSDHSSCTPCLKSFNGFPFLLGKKKKTDPLTHPKVPIWSETYLSLQPHLLPSAHPYSACLPATQTSFQSFILLFLPAELVFIFRPFARHGFSPPLQLVNYYSSFRSLFYFIFLRKLSMTSLANSGHPNLGSHSN